jgi:hypothetical protein
VRRKAGTEIRRGIEGMSIRGYLGGQRSLQDVGRCESGEEAWLASDAVF